MKKQRANHNDTTSTTLGFLSQRRWLRFSLRAVLVLIAIIAVLLWIPIKRARTQRRAVAEVEGLGGFVDYDFRWNDQKEPAAPVWLRRLLSDDYFQTAYTIDLIEKNVTDDDLEVLHDLPQLHFVFLKNCPNLTDESVKHVAGLSQLKAFIGSGLRLTDKGLAHLRNNTGLEVLCLDDTRVTDAGIANLAGMRRLRRLDLSSTPITDDGLKTIGALPLHTLVIANTPKISDAGIVHLRAMEELEDLNLNDDHKTRLASITDAGIAKLDDLSTLRGLNLAGGAITDAAMPHLLKHTALEVLDLSHTQLTDDGLVQLAALPKLELLYIQGTAVTEDGIDRLQQKLPNLTIHYD